MTPAARVPASAQAVGLDLKAKPLNCASRVLPLPKGCVDPDTGRGRWRRADLGLGREESARPRPGSSAPRRRTFWNWPAAPSTPSPPRWACPAQPLPVVGAHSGTPAGRVPGGGRAKGVGCCFRSPPAAHSPTAQLEGSSSSEGREGEPRFSAATLAPSPPPFLQSFCHPLPARESSGKAGLTQSAGELALPAPSRGHP